MQKHPAPEDWLYKEARHLFMAPDVVDCATVDLKWTEPSEDDLIQFMCTEKQFRYALPPLPPITLTTNQMKGNRNAIVGNMGVFN